MRLGLMLNEPEGEHSCLADNTHNDHFYNGVGIRNDYLGSWPWSDMLLHDMRPGLADNRSEGRANGQEWRMAPLWGIGMTETVSGHTYFARMRSNLTYLSLAGTIRERVEHEPELHRNSIRHDAARHDGLTGFAMQWDGAPGAAPPLPGLHRRGEAPVLEEEPLADESAMQGYTGSVAFNGDRREIVITSPRGRRLHPFSADGAFLGAVSRDGCLRVCAGVRQISRKRRAWRAEQDRPSGSGTARGRSAHGTTSSFRCDAPAHPAGEAISRNCRSSRRPADATTTEIGRIRGRSGKGRVRPPRDPGAFASRSDRVRGFRVADDLTCCHPKPEPLRRDAANLDPEAIPGGSSGRRSAGPPRLTAPARDDPRALRRNGIGQFLHDLA